MMIRHEGLAHFSQGTFTNGGDNLFVDANGVMRRIADNDLNRDGIFDLVLPNSHGYIERAPTEIHTLKHGRWKTTTLPHDSGWMPRAVDVDGDGHLDLVIANGENGVTSELPSYIYWGGPHGLTGECAVLQTIGAYDVAACDLNGNGLKDLIFTTAWYDHHNPGIPLWQKVFLQTAPRQFVEATDEFKIAGVATTSLLCEDLNNDGQPDLVLGNRREQRDPDTDSFVYFGSAAGIDPSHPLRLPTRNCTQVEAVDLSGDGFKDLIFTGSNEVRIYWNIDGTFHADRLTRIEVIGTFSQFTNGMLATAVADIDNDGVPELMIGMRDGIEIRKATDLHLIHDKLSCYGCSWLAAVDIRNMGRPDLIASHYCSQKTYDTESQIFWNTGAGYDPEQITAFQTHGPMGCTAADLDHDGVKEVIFCNTMKGPSQYDPEFPVFVYFGNAAHEYRPENRRDYPITYMAHSYIAADLDNDGHTELAVTSAHGIRIFKGTASGPDPTDFSDIIHPLGDQILIGGVLAGDFNRDGWLDLIMAPWVKSDRDEVRENSVFVYFGGPDGYSQQRRLALPADVRCAQGILVADINNDGYMDFLYGSRQGYVGVYYGGPKGFDPNRWGKFDLKDHNGAWLFMLTAADIDQDGWLELFVTTSGHYTRHASHLYILRDGRNGYPVEKTVKFETGGSTGLPSLADMTGDENLDLLLPLYSTTDARVLPARIFHGNGKGEFDWDHPLQIECESSIAFLPVDLNGNGYKDLFICCHRNDLGHTVHSRLIRNGPDGLDVAHAENILGYGPHSFTVKEQGNGRDRSEDEYYTSPVFECRRPTRLRWEGGMPSRTALRFRVRFGQTPQAVRAANWSLPITACDRPLNTGDDVRFMQYEVAFHAPAFVNSPTLRSVTIECEL